MLKLKFALSIIISVQIFASESKDLIERRSLEASSLIGTFLDAGIRPNMQKNAPVFRIELENLTCLSSYNHSSDNIFTNIPSFSCKDNTNHFSPSASHTIWNELTKSGVSQDCAMGKCYLSTKMIYCTKDTSNTKELTDGIVCYIEE